MENRVDIEQALQPRHSTEDDSEALAPHVFAVAVALQGPLRVFALARHLRGHGTNDAPAALLHSHGDGDGLKPRIFWSCSKVSRSSNTAVETGCIWLSHLS